MDSNFLSEGLCILWKSSVCTVLCQIPVDITSSARCLQELVKSCFKLEMNPALSVFCFKRDIAKLQRLQKQLTIYFQTRENEKKSFFQSI